MRRVALVLAVMALVLVLASGVAWAVTKVGTNGHDRLRGTNGSDELVGRGGDDWIFGYGGKDVLSGGPGSDTYLDGGPGADVISGGPGSEYELDGGPGVDVMSGGPGNDWMIDGPVREFAVDRLEGGDGDDHIETWNEPVARDIVSCGAGRDYAEVDRKDIVGDNCERVVLH